MRSKRRIHENSITGPVGLRCGCSHVGSIGELPGLRDWRNIVAAISAPDQKFRTIVGALPSAPV